MEGGSSGPHSPHSRDGIGVKPDLGEIELDDARDGVGDCDEADVEALGLYTVNELDNAWHGSIGCAGALVGARVDDLDDLGANDTSRIVPHGRVLLIAKVEGNTEERLLAGVVPVFVVGAHAWRALEEMWLGEG